MCQRHFDSRGSNMWNRLSYYRSCPWQCPYLSEGLKINGQSRFFSHDVLALQAGGGWVVRTMSTMLAIWICSHWRVFDASWRAPRPPPLYPSIPFSPWTLRERTLGLATGWFEKGISSTCHADVSIWVSRLKMQNETGEACSSQPQCIAAHALFTGMVFKGANFETLDERGRHEVATRRYTTTTSASTQ